MHRAEHLSPVPDKETAACGTIGLRGGWGCGDIKAEIFFFFNNLLGFFKYI